METEFIVTIILGLLSLAVNFYQVHREDKVRGKIKSWLESARGIHAVAQPNNNGEIARFVNSMVVDLEDELKQNHRWRVISFCSFLLAFGILIGMLIVK